MKFVTVKIPCTVEESDPGGAGMAAVSHGILELRLTAHNAERPHETLERLARLLDAKMNLTDIGDET